MVLETHFFVRMVCAQGPSLPSEFLALSFSTCLYDSHVIRHASPIVLCNYQLLKSLFPISIFETSMTHSKNSMIFKDLTFSLWNALFNARQYSYSMSIGTSITCLTDMFMTNTTVQIVFTIKTLNNSIPAEHSISFQNYFHSLEDDIRNVKMKPC